MILKGIAAFVRETGRVLLRNPHGLLHHPMQLRHGRLKTVHRTVLLTTPALLGFKSLTFSRTTKKQTLSSLLWCEKRDLNPYGVNHTPLKRARLPVPPLSRFAFRVAPQRLRNLGLPSAAHLKFRRRFSDNANIIPHPSRFVNSFLRKNRNFY